MMYRGHEIIIPSKRINHDNIDLFHPDIKCEYGPNCRDKIRNMKELHSHYIKKHKKDFANQTTPLKPLVLHWPSIGWNVFVQFGSCPKIINIGWTKQIFGTECLNRELMLVENCKESVVKTIDAENFFRMCSEPTECLRVKENFRKSLNVDYKVRNNLRWMEFGSKFTTGYRRYYAFLFVSLKKVYIGSTGQKLQYRLYRHERQNSEALEILSQPDCIITEFACGRHNAQKRQYQSRARILFRQSDDGCLKNDRVYFVVYR